MFVKVEDNPTGGADNKEAKWWKDWLNKKKVTHEQNSEQIEALRKQQLNLQVQSMETKVELGRLCARYEELVKQLAVEQRIGYKSEHRRLEVDEE